LAAKWEAFLDRGDEDFFASKDLEDIISVIAGRPELSEEVLAADEEVQDWLRERARDFLAHPDSEYAILGSLPDAGSIPGLVAEVRGRFAAMGSS
jgi:hypothetical protein